MPSRSPLAEHHQLRSASRPVTAQRVEMSGEIDLVSAPKFEAAVRRAARIGTPNLVFHVDQVSFMDARGLRVFALAIRLLGERHVTVIGASRALRRLLELAGLGRRLVLEEWAR